MGRKEPVKGVHTSPAKAGAQNLEGVVLPVDEDNLMVHALYFMEQGKNYTQHYKGLWDEQSFGQAVDDFFVYCGTKGIKPTKPAIQLWLGVSRDQYNEWVAKADKYGYKSDILKRANLIMEMYLQNQIDKYPTGSIFLLKTSHGHVETSRVDVNTGNVPTSPDEVKEIVSRLGLNQG